MLARLRIAVPIALGTSAILVTGAGECWAQARVRIGNQGQTPPASQPSSPAPTVAPTPTDEPEANQPGDDRRQSPFNDPSFRLRALRARITGEGGMFGRGGRGGPGGQGGEGLITMLRENEALQKAINLTPEQKSALDRVNSEMREKRSQLRSQMRDRRGGNRQGGFNATRAAYEALDQETEAAYSQVLTEDQRRRIREIELQIIGLTAVARPDVMARLNLSPGQQQQVMLIMQQVQATRNQAAQAMREQMAAARAGRNRGQQGGPGGPGQVRGGFPGQFPQPGPANARGGPGQGPGGFDRQQFMARMQQMNEDQDRLRKLAEQQIAKVLTARQEQRFVAMLGEPFDLLLLVEPRNRNDNNRRGGGPAQDEDDNEDEVEVEDENAAPATPRAFGRPAPPTAGAGGQPDATTAPVPPRAFGGQRP